MGGEYSTDRTW